MGILFFTLRSFQPGGLQERTDLLRGLTSLGQADNAAATMASLHLWVGNHLCPPQPLKKAIAMSPAIEALLEGIATSPYCDNSAAVQICLYDTGSWRTRNLRRRSANIHYNVEASEWKLAHLEGVFMTADIGTKALGPSRFEDLLQAMELSLSKTL